MQWVDAVMIHLSTGGPVCRVVVAEVKGSAPREAGAWMLVGANGIDGTIGGGSLEYEAMALARKLIGGEGRWGFKRQWRTFALGPSLGQCCGGSVTLLFEAFQPRFQPEIAALKDAKAAAWAHGEDANTPPRPAEAVESPTYKPSLKELIMPESQEARAFYLYGAGHVGRALIAVTGELGLDRHWVDDDAARFPDAPPDDVTLVPAKDMTAIARRAPSNAIHIVMTYSHQLDEAIVHAVLAGDGFARLGLIGSKTKRQRFCSSLAKAGIGADALDRLVCPIGLPQVTGKEPARVALSIAAQLAAWMDEDGAL